MTYARIEGRRAPLIPDAPSSCTRWPPWGTESMRRGGKEVKRNPNSVTIRRIRSIDSSRHLRNALRPSVMRFDSLCPTWGGTRLTRDQLPRSGVARSLPSLAYWVDPRS